MLFLAGLIRLRTSQAMHLPILLNIGLTAEQKPCWLLRRRQAGLLL